MSSTASIQCNGLYVEVAYRLIPSEVVVVTRSPSSSVSVM